MQQKRNSFTPNQLMVAGLLLEHGIEVYISHIFKHTKSGPYNSFEGYKWSADGKALNFPGLFDRSEISIHSYDSMSDCLRFGITMGKVDFFETGYACEVIANKPE